jgi:hypothetical protein
LICPFAVFALLFSLNLYIFGLLGYVIAIGLTILPSSYGLLYFEM